MKRGLMRGLPVALVGVVTGIWLGQPPGGEASNLPEAKTERVSGRSAARAPASRNPGRTYSALMRQFVHTKGLPAEAIRSIESATNQELRDMLRALMVEELPGHPYRPGPQKQRDLMSVAAAELLHREGGKALQWAAEVENFDLSLALMNAAAAQDPALMKEWLGKLGEHWEAGWNSSLMTTAKREAALRSAVDLLAVEPLFPESLVTDLRGVAPSFDFRAYLKATQNPYAGEVMYGFWAALDPESATRHVHEVLNAAHDVGIGGVAGHAMEGRAKLTSEAEAMKWIGGVVGDLTGRTRELAVRGLADRNSSPGLILQLPSDGDRVLFAATSLQKNYHSLDLAMPVLKAMPSQALQAEAVGRWVYEMGDAEAHVLDEVMESLDFADPQREALRAKLPTEH